MKLHSSIHVFCFSVFVPFPDPKGMTKQALARARSFLIGPNNNKHSRRTEIRFPSPRFRARVSLPSGTGGLISMTRFPLHDPSDTEFKQLVWLVCRELMDSNIASFAGGRDLIQATDIP